MSRRVLAALGTTISEHGRAATLFCVTLLVAACASASLIFTCATPFAAFAVLAAAVLPLRSALITIGVVWGVNQAIGYGLLGYPVTLSSAMWGLALGAAALVATIIAARMFDRLAGIGRFSIYPIVLVVAFAAYELCLLAVTPALGGGEAFAFDIIGRIALLNATWLAVLAGVYEGARLLDGLARRHALR